MAQQTSIRAGTGPETCVRNPWLRWRWGKEPASSITNSYDSPPFFPQRLYMVCGWISKASRNPKMKTWKRRQICLWGLHTEDVVGVMVPGFGPFPHSSTCDRDDYGHHHWSCIFSASDSTQFTFIELFLWPWYGSPQWSKGTGQDKTIPSFWTSIHEQMYKPMGPYYIVSSTWTETLSLFLPSSSLPTSPVLPTIHLPHPPSFFPSHYRPGIVLGAGSRAINRKRSVLIRHMF